MITLLFETIKHLLYASFSRVIAVSIESVYTDPPYCDTERYSVYLKILSNIQKSFYSETQHFLAYLP